MHLRRDEPLPFTVSKNTSCYQILNTRGIQDDCTSVWYVEYATDHSTICIPDGLHIRQSHNHLPFKVLSSSLVLVAESRQYCDRDELRSMRYMYGYIAGFALRTSRERVL
jgi:hypothetical protein